MSRPLNGEKAGANGQGNAEKAPLPFFEGAG